MKKQTKNFSIVLLILLGLLAACGNDEKGEATTSVPESTEEDKTTENESTSTKENTDQENDSSDETTNTDSTASENSDTDEKAQEALSDYSNEQIEYARVWLQLGANQDIDGLYVQHIPAGTPLNPEDETSLAYPEDVIQLAGSRLVDGSITYSGNGDGTINIYNVPLRWDGEYPAGEKFYTDMINQTELASINPGNDDEVIELIKLIKIN